MQRKPRILMANIGLDGHEMGAIVVSTALRDAGMEVIYLGLCQTPENIVETAIQEDVDVVGISSMSGVHDEVMPIIVNLLKEKGVNIPIIIGGIIPKEDIPQLKQVGVKGVFSPGTPTKQIIEFIQSIVEE